MPATFGALPAKSNAADAFAGQLRERRRAAGLTQEALAERAGLSVRGISDLERGLKAPQRATVDLLARALALPPEAATAFVLAAQRRRAGQDTGDGRAGPDGDTLPVPMTTFVGRERELDQVARLLDRSRLVTLTGPGGVGKTRLALEVAAAARPAFPDGVRFVACADLRDPALLPAAVAAALGVQEGPARPLLAVLADLLAGRRALLVLDNLEQLEGAAPFLGRLLAACPALALLATSRAPLAVYGEQAFPVPPLALPDPARPPPPEGLRRVEAVALFVARAVAVRPDFALSSGNASAVAAICRRLDGLPLAIELAAARIRLLPPAALLGRLEHRLALLTGGAADLPPRQRTLRATLDWSYELLSPDERALFRRLGVFAGGATLESIELLAPAVGSLDLDLLEGLDALVRHSLLRQEEHDAEPRFAMLETVREFALEQLALAGEEAATRNAHVEALLQLLDGDLGPERRGQVQGGSALRLPQLERERENLRLALAWCADREDTVRGLRLASRATALWVLAGPRAEGLGWLRRFLDRASIETPDWLRLRALDSAAWLARWAGEPAAARAYTAAALALAEARRDERAMADALYGAAALATQEGDLAAAQAAADRWLALVRGGASPDWRGTALMLVGIVAHLRGDAARAAARYREALTLGATPQWARRNLAYLALETGRTEEAATSFREALAEDWGLRTDAAALESLNALAALAREQGRWGRAARLLGAADAGLDRLGGVLLEPIGRRERERTLAAARARLGAPAFAAAYTIGRALSLEQAVAFASEEGAKPKGL